MGSKFADSRSHFVMNWEAIAAISQLVAALGVIISLVYLAVQVRCGTTVANTQV